MADVVEHHLAQINVARPKAALDDPVMSGFVSAMARIGQLASNSRGFVWQPGDGDPITSDGLVVNLSVWTGFEALHEFVYRSRHGSFVRRRDHWFVPMDQPSTALWWVPVGERPTVEDGLRRLAVLRRQGPSPQAFGLPQAAGAPPPPSPAPDPGAAAPRP
ncbi:DUF3291 domain-containing protein [Dactylosporangium sucinum]|uniref:DUF3291 domain-containing protein n=1 Tax=Dactylosporangium sucinum TaxID=1424081 RepID=UPI0035EB12CF